MGTCNSSEDVTQADKAATKRLEAEHRKGRKETAAKHSEEPRPTTISTAQQPELQATRKEVVKPPIKSRQERRKELQEKKMREQQQQLADVAAERSDPQKLAPAPISVCMAWIEQHGLSLCPSSRLVNALPTGLDETGLFRIPGSYDTVQGYKRRFDLGEYDLVIPPDECVENVASVVIRYLTDLESEGGLQGKDRGARLAWNKKAVTFRTPKPLSAGKEMLLSLQPPCLEVIRQIVAVLNKASKPEHTAHNQMSAKKFALCTFPACMDLLQMLIQNYDEIFPLEYGDEHDGKYRGVRIPPN